MYCMYCASLHTHRKRHFDAKTISGCLDAVRRIRDEEIPFPVTKVNTGHLVSRFTISTTVQLHHPPIV